LSEDDQTPHFIITAETGLKPIILIPPTLHHYPNDFEFTITQEAIDSLPSYGTMSLEISNIYYFGRLGNGKPVSIVLFSEKSVLEAMRNSVDNTRNYDSVEGKGTDKSSMRLVLDGESESGVWIKYGICWRIPFLEHTILLAGYADQIKKLACKIVV